MKPMLYVDGASPDAINTAIRSNLKSVTRWSTPVIVYCTSPGAAVSVAHDLGAVPNTIAVEPWIDCRWWADQDDRSVWTASNLIFHASHSGRFTVRAGFQ